jgi:hypothetical protein
MQHSLRPVDKGHYIVYCENSNKRYLINKSKLGITNKKLENFFVIWKIIPRVRKIKKL